MAPTSRTAVDQKTRDLDETKRARKNGAPKNENKTDISALTKARTSIVLFFEVFIKPKGFTYFRINYMSSLSNFSERAC